MGKIKHPALSLGASGTVADAITFQRSHRQNIVREKPIPTDPRSLPQLYHRWLYQDYLDMWAQLTEAQKQVYKSAGARENMTGLAYFLRPYLKTLSDIVGWWRLDERAGAIAHDSSKNANHGTILGAIHVPGTIDYGLAFDGIDDFINCGYDASMDFTDAFTIDLFINRKVAGVRHTLVARREGGLGAGCWYAEIGAGNRASFSFFNSVTGAWVGVLSSIALILTGLYHLSFIFDGARMYIYVDGYLDNSRLQTGKVNTDTNHIYICRFPGRFFKGIADNVYVYNRALPPTTVLRHSERRYPE